MRAVVLIVFAGFLVYFNSLGGAFLYDDGALIINNPSIKSWAHLPEIFITQVDPEARFSSTTYRPILILSYLLDHSLWGLNVFGYHLTNIILHIMVAVFIYWLALVLYKKRMIALAAGIFFVSHPIHTEAVSYISGRADMLAALFLLASFICYIKTLEKFQPGLYAIALFSYSMALLSRENSLIFPAVLLPYHYVFKKKIELKKILPFIVLAGAYIFLRFNLFTEPLNHRYCTTTVLQRLPGFFAAIVKYLTLLIAPFGLHMEYGKGLFGFTNPQVLAGIAISAMLIAYAIFKRKNNRLVSFSILWFFLALLPSSNIYPLSVYMAEHWLYLPSIGFFMILGGAMAYIYKKRNVRLLGFVLISGLLLFYSCLTIRQNAYWKDPANFYKKTLLFSPENAKLYNNLATEYRNAGRFEEAIALYEKSIKIDPRYALAYYNYGIACDDIGKKAEAVELFKKAIEIDPFFAEAYNNLGVLYASIGRLEDGAIMLRKAIDIKPNYKDAVHNLSLTGFLRRDNR